jgi:Phosphotransferase enzyme family
VGERGSRPTGPRAIGAAIVVEVCTGIPGEAANLAADGGPVPRRAAYRWPGDRCLARRHHCGLGSRGGRRGPSHLHDRPEPGRPALADALRGLRLGGQRRGARRSARDGRDTEVRGSRDGAGPRPRRARAGCHRGNTLWRGGELAAVIDWDCAGLGAAGVDLGSVRCDAAMPRAASRPVRDRLPRARSTVPAPGWVVIIGGCGSFRPGR